jgi:glycosyltransferase involved in cell wall biosynthesis
VPINKANKKIKVLHIGNIANNAYLNAKFLRSKGIEADVLCYDYYHVMGCPEWEDAEFDANAINQFQPDWTTVTFQKKFERPDWFAQGPLSLAVDYLLAYRTNNNKKFRLYQSKLNIVNKTFRETSNIFNSKSNSESESKKNIFFTFQNFIITSAPLLSLIREYSQHINEIKKRSESSNKKINPALIYSLSVLLAFKRAFSNRLSLYLTSPLQDFIYRIFDNKNSDYKRKKRLLESCKKIGQDIYNNDINIISQLSKTRIEELLSHYDLVHGYATDGCLPLFYKKPYVAYEHGTIRNIPFTDSSQGRLCAATYKLANQVIITNADNILAAEKLHLRKFNFVPHPVNDFAIEEIRNISDKLHQDLHNQLNSEFIIFHPSRQHWEERRHPDWEKGNDYFIKGFAKFVRETYCHAKAIFVEWGASIQESKDLIKSLGITDNIIWIPPMPHIKMVETIFATDALADQFFLGAFGSTTPKALACGRPTLLYLDEELHSWCFDEMPPVLNANNPEGIFNALQKLYLDKNFYTEISEESKNWYQKNHSSSVIIERLTSIYANVIAESKIATN